jgi:hypothetical protein
LFFTLACTCSFSQKNVGQNSAEEKIVKFYPNPASDVITFDINHVVEKGYVIQIYNFLGRQVLVVPITSNHFTVTLKDFFRGPYVFQLRDKNGVIIEANKFQVNK